MLSGEVKVSWSWNGYRARQEKPSLKYAHTKDGANLVIPKTAPKLETDLFLDFMTEPENAACYAKYSYAIKDSKEFIDPALAGAPELNLPAGTPDTEFVNAV